MSKRLSEAAAGREPEIVLQNPNRYPEVHTRHLERWLHSLLRELAPETHSLTVRFIGDRKMRQLNRRYRGRDSMTDVLSFPGASGPEGRHLGDVAISVPAARRQAAKGGAERELKVLLLHAVLHCLGHDHETDEGAMSRLERRLRRRWISDAG